MSDFTPGHENSIVHNLLERQDEVLDQLNQLEADILAEIETISQLRQQGEEMGIGIDATDPSVDNEPPADGSQLKLPPKQPSSKQPFRAVKTQSKTLT